MTRDSRPLSKSCLPSAFVWVEYLCHRKVFPHLCFATGLATAGPGQQLSGDMSWLIMSLQDTKSCIDSIHSWLLFSFKKERSTLPPSPLIAEAQRCTPPCTSSPSLKWNPRLGSTARGRGSLLFLSYRRPRKRGGEGAQRSISHKAFSRALGFPERWERRDTLHFLILCARRVPRKISLTFGSTDFGPCMHPHYNQLHSYLWSVGFMGHQRPSLFNHLPSKVAGAVQASPVLRIPGHTGLPPVPFSFERLGVDCPFLQTAPHFKAYLARKASCKDPQQQIKKSCQERHKYQAYPALHSDLFSAKQG